MADPFGQALAAGCGDLIERHIAQDRELRAKAGQQLEVFSLHLLRAFPHPVDFPQDFGQWDQAVERLRLGRPGARGAVGQRLDAVHHADRDRLAADLAEAAVGQCVRRRPDDVAGAVTVEVVFAFLGEEFDRTTHPPSPLP